MHPSTTEALLTYATTLAFYLHLRTSEKYVHPILQRLLTLKQSLHTLEELDFAAAGLPTAVLCGRRGGKREGFAGPMGWS